MLTNESGLDKTLARRVVVSLLLQALEEQLEEICDSYVKNELGGFRDPSRADQQNFFRTQFHGVLEDLRAVVDGSVELQIGKRDIEGQLRALLKGRTAPVIAPGKSAKYGYMDTTYGLMGVNRRPATEQILSLIETWVEAGDVIRCTERGEVPTYDPDPSYIKWNHDSDD